MKIRRKKTREFSKTDNEPVLLSLRDHLQELQNRLFSVIFVFVVSASIAYPFFDQIANWLLAPLQGEQELVYLTPGGAFSFIIKVCAYVGLICTLPIIVYHIYRFIMPAVQTVRLRKVLGYTTASVLLAIIGILFAYYISLPAALYFLTGFDLHHISPMLTIDSYFSFIMTYMLAGAILFQVPLLMLITNSVTPLTPRKLMGAQKYIIVGSFIVAAIISPTPDALNQTLLAAPVIVMYQIGILLVWRINAKARRSAKKGVVAEVTPKVSEPLQTRISVTPEAVPVQPVQVALASKQVPGALSVRSLPMRRSMDIVPSNRSTIRYRDRGISETRSHAASASRSSHLPPVRGTIDGMVRI